MTSAALASPAPARGLRLRTSDLLYTRRGLLLLALLGPALLWFGVVYLGSLFALLANAFFGLDDFTGAKAAGADANVAADAIDEGVDALQVRALHLLGLDVGMRDVVADKALLAADVALVGHDGQTP